MTATQQFYSKVSSIQDSECGGNFQRAFDLARVRFAGIYQQMFVQPLSSANERRSVSQRVGKLPPDGLVKLTSSIHSYAAQFGHDVTTTAGWNAAYQGAMRQMTQSDPLPEGSDRSAIAKDRRSAADEFSNIVKRVMKETGQSWDESWQSVWRERSDLVSRMNQATPINKNTYHLTNQ